MEGPEWAKARSVWRVARFDVPLICADDEACTTIWDVFRSGAYQFCLIPSDIASKISGDECRISGMTKQAIFLKQEVLPAVGKPGAPSRTLI